MAVEAPFRTALTVTGMTCEHCERAVVGELSTVDGVRSVEVDLASGSVIVTSSRELSHDDLASAIDEAGYQLAR